MATKRKLSGWLFNNGHMTSDAGHMITGAGHMTDASHMTAVSESMVEHLTSVSIEQGYDSMMFNAMIEECHSMWAMIYFNLYTEYC